MSRPVLLVQIAAADLPNTTPVAQVAAPWVPYVYTAPLAPAPGNVEATPAADAITITWDAVAGAAEYIVQVAPAAAGPWKEVARIRGTRYTYTTTSTATLYFKVLAVINGIPGNSGGANGVPVSVPTEQEMVAIQVQQDQDRADSVQRDLDAVASAAADATAKANAARVAAIAHADVIGAQVADILDADTWVSTKTYPAGDLVKRAGKLYRALLANTNKVPESNAADWQLIGNYSSLGEAVAGSISIGTQNASDIAVQSGRLDGVIGRLPAGAGQLATAASVDQLQINVNNVDGKVTAAAENLSLVSASLGDIVTMQNPSFEAITGNIGWGTDGNGTNNTLPPSTSFSGNDGYAAHGQYALRFDGDSANPNRTWYNAKRFDLRNAKRLWLSFDSRSVGSAPAVGTQLRIGIRYYDKAGVYIANSYIPWLTADGGSWLYGAKPIGSWWAIPATAMFARVILYVQGHTTGGILLDNLVCELETATGKITADGLAATNVTVSQQGQTLTQQGSRLDGITADLEGKASVGSVSELSTKIVQAEGNIAANSDALTSVNATLGAVTQGLTIVAGSTPISSWVLAGTGTGEFAIVATTDTTVMGGQLLSVGNNNGNDMAFARHQTLMAYDPSKLYRVRVRGYVGPGSAGVPTWYAGLAGMDKDKANYVNTAGALVSTLASAFYVASGKTNTSLEEFIGYFKGFSTTGARTGSGTLADPWKMPANVAWITTMFIANYNGQTGRTYFDKLIIEDADAIGDSSAVAQGLSDLSATVGTQGQLINAQAISINQVTAAVEGASASITSLMEVSAVSNSIGLVDGGFETDKGWGASATLDTPATVLPAKTQYRTDIYRSGARCLRFDPAITSAVSVFNNSWLRVKVGQKIRLTYWARMSGAAGTDSAAYIRMSVRRFPASGAATYSYAAGSTPVSSLSTVWQKVTAIYTVISGDASLQFAVQCLNNNANTAVYVDDVSVELIGEEAESARAKNALLVDVNGVVSGYVNENDGSRSSFSILGTVFRVISTLTGMGMEWLDGYLRIWKGSAQLVLGHSFGSGDLVMWYGPNVGAASCTKANGLFHLDTSGGGYFGGSLSAGTLKNAVQTTTTVTTGTELVNGPFNTNGNTRSVVLSFGRSMVYTSNANGSSGFTAGAGSNTATVQLYRKIGTAAETLWQTLNVAGSIDIMNEPDAPDRAVSMWGGALTVNDTSVAGTPVTYRAVITGYTSQNVSHPGTINSITTTQNLSIISTEQ